MLWFLRINYIQKKYIYIKIWIYLKLKSGDESAKFGQFLVLNEFDHHKETKRRPSDSFYTDSNCSFKSKSQTFREDLSTKSMKQQQQQAVASFREMIPNFDKFQFHINKPKQSLSIDLTTKIASKLTGILKFVLPHAKSLPKLF